MLVKPHRIFLSLALMAGGAFAQSNLDETHLRQRALQRQQRQEEFYRTRAFPGSAVPPGARAAAIEEMNRMAAAEKARHGEAPAGSTWTLIGPRPTNTLTESSAGGSPY